ncbi:hypothetical protein CNYM01_02751 [Colletotrichum nymphaeae SA-01]|uniref:Uncharacterized protein n=1 Tax=Colletotrichum nymphaeae SA-01 TaxID=1460502 RepID=A0A135T630_9PEZI|nr:hypothetical protein CNYM01_02751 [Colletotrichum nymphaeae SA-01]
MPPPGAATVLFDLRNDLETYFPAYDRPEGHKSAPAAQPSDGSKTVEEFTFGRVLDAKQFISLAKDPFMNEASLEILDEDQLLSTVHPSLEACSEADTSALCARHFFNAAEHIFKRGSDGVNMGQRRTEFRSSMEYSFVPSGRTHHSTKKNALVPESLRTDFLFVFKDSNENLSIGDCLPGEPSRPFAVMELKCFGFLDDFVEDLRRVQAGGTRNFRSKQKHILKYHQSTQVRLGQVARYCFGVRTEFGALCDYKWLVLLHFDGMQIHPGATPIQVHTKGHGGRFSYCIVERHRAKPLVWAGFLKFAALHTPADD